MSRNNIFKDFISSNNLRYIHRIVSLNYTTIDFNTYIKNFLKLMENHPTIYEVEFLNAEFFKYCSQDAKESYAISMLNKYNLRPKGLEHLNKEPLHQRQKTKYSSVFVNEDEERWRAGNANRTAEQTMAEYWGEGSVSSNVQTDRTKVGRAYEGENSWTTEWKKNGSKPFGTRPPPLWHMNGIRAHEKDIDETLGSSSEFDSKVYKYDTS